MVPPPGERGAPSAGTSVGGAWADQPDTTRSRLPNGTDEAVYGSAVAARDPEAPIRILFLIGALLAACAKPPDPKADAGGPHDTAGADSGDTGADSGDTDTPLPLGDNLIARGAGEDAMLEPTGTLWLGDDRLALCTGTQGLAVFDVSDTAALSTYTRVMLPAPAGFRCQHLDASDSGLLVATHHGDETSPGWIALVDVSDPDASTGLDVVQPAGMAPEGVALVGDTAYVAMHTDGLWRFDLSGRTLDVATRFGDVVGNAQVVAVGPDGTIAVGTLDGEVELVEADGGRRGAVAVSGPVFDLEWLGDGTLIAACASGGVDRLDPTTLSVLAHADVRGTAIDAAALGDGNIAVAGWSDLRVFAPNDLALLGVEDAGDGTDLGGFFGVDAHADTLFVAEWQALRTYAWLPGYEAPDIHVETTRVDFGSVGAGEPAAYALVLRNEGARPLTITAVTPSHPEVTVDRTTLTLPPGGADYVELRWTSTGNAFMGSVSVTSDDPDEPTVLRPLSANQPTAGVGDLVPAFAYLAFNGAETWRSRDLGAPALLSYFATY